jgi:hypothetical protein
MIRTYTATGGRAGDEYGMFRYNDAQLQLPLRLQLRLATSGTTLARAKISSVGTSAWCAQGSQWLMKLLKPACLQSWHMALPYLQRILTFRGGRQVQDVGLATARPPALPLTRHRAPSNWVGCSLPWAPLTAPLPASCPAPLSKATNAREVLSRPKLPSAFAGWIRRRAGKAHRPTPGCVSQ